MKRFIKYLSIAIVSLLVIAGLVYQSMLVPSLSYEELSDYAYETLKLPNGMQVNYKEQGNPQGRPMLLVHGGSANLGDWAFWTDSFSDYRVISVDLPGHGLTDPLPDRNYSRANMAEFLEHFIAALQLQDIIIMGHSMGGEYSLQYTIDNPDNVQAIIALAPGVYRDDIFDTEVEALAFELAQSPIAPLLHNLNFIGEGEELKKFYNDYVGVDPADYPEYVRDMQLIGRYEKNRSTLLELVVGMYDNPYMEGVETIKAPMLILWGDQDQVADPNHAPRLHKDVEGSTLIMYPGLGHGLTILTQEKGAQDVLNYLQSVGLGETRE